MSWGEAKYWCVHLAGLRLRFYDFSWGPELCAQRPNHPPVPMMKYDGIESFSAVLAKPDGKNHVTDPDTLVFNNDRPIGRRKHRAYRCLCLWIVAHPLLCVPGVGVEADFDCGAVRATNTVMMFILSMVARPARLEPVAHPYGSSH